MRQFLCEKEFPAPNFFYDFNVRSCKKISHSVYVFDFVPYSRWDIRREPIYFKATNKRVSDAYKAQTGFKMKGALEDIAQCVLNKLKDCDSDIGAFMVYFSHGNETGDFDGVPFALRGKLCSMAESQGLCMY